MTQKSILDQDLVFPDAPDFVSVTIQYTASEMVLMCEPMLPLWNQKRYSQAEPEFLGEAFSLE